jgi:hypothetical protein
VARAALRVREILDVLLNVLLNVLLTPVFSDQAV